MADSSQSWLFTLSAEEVSLNADLLRDPARLRLLRDEDAQQFLMRHDPEAFYGTSRRYFVESWITKNIGHLPGLGYVTQGFALLEAADIKLALRDIEKAFERIKMDDWSYWGLDRSGILDALAMPYPQLWEEARSDGSDQDNPHYLIVYLRQHRQILEESLTLGQAALYLLYLVDF